MSMASSLAQSDFSVHREHWVRHQAQDAQHSGVRQCSFTPPKIKLAAPLWGLTCMQLHRKALQALALLPPRRFTARA